jgi:hypothetical protein
MAATTVDTKAAIINKSITTTAVKGDMPPSNIPTNSNGMVTKRGCAIVRNWGCTVALRALRTLGISDSNNEAPLANIY